MPPTHGEKDVPRFLGVPEERSSRSWQDVNGTELVILIGDPLRRAVV